MSSGVAANPECIEVFQQELKLGKRLRYIIYRLNDTFSEIIVEKKVGQEGTYEQFLEDLPENSPRFAVYDFEFEKEGAGRRNKILFISWSPDTSKIREKMVYSSSKDALRRTLVGIAVEIQGTDLEEVSYESVLDKVNRGA